MHEYKIVDADTGKQHTMTVIPDRHGLTIQVTGFDQDIVCDLSASGFRVYTTAPGRDDIVDDPVCVLC